jgi:hypothetical protein
MGGCGGKAQSPEWRGADGFWLLLYAVLCCGSAIDVYISNTFEVCLSSCLTKI